MIAANPSTIVNTALDALWYNVFATNDAVQKLGGNPFGNKLTLVFRIEQRSPAEPSRRAVRGRARRAVRAASRIGRAAT